MAPLILILLFVVAWVILIVPKQRELKRHNALVAGLSVGDDVMTGSGIYGTIVSIDGDLVELQVAPGVEIRIARRAIASLVIDPDAEIVDESFGELEPDDETDSLGGGTDR
jgi:preprotein translocase subunit YajC